MSHRYRSRKIQNIINLDSLTDIVANCIGVILFLLLFALLSSRTTFFNFYVPSDMNPDDRSRIYVPIAEDTVKRRHSFLCSDGTIIPLDFNGLYDQIIADLPTLTYENFDNVVALMNSRRVTNRYLIAQITATAQESGYSSQKSKSYRDLKFIINRNGDIPGETSVMLNADTSNYVGELNGIAPDGHWVCFYVESDSLDIFRKAREIAWEKGFDVGWEPSVVEWPQVIDLLSRPPTTGGWNISPNINQGGT